MAGIIEVFTGNGRGKSSAALGIVLRALGHGLRVHIIYFMKGDFPYGEQKVLSRIPNVTFATFGQEGFVDPANVKPGEKEQARQALEEARRAIYSHEYDLIVLDEVNVALAWKLIDLDEMIGIIKDKPDRLELILTGRYADGKITRLADLVTEMVEVKHPYQKGIFSRPGFDY
jgi:cob(I)alamin adenosyltransferase